MAKGSITKDAKAGTWTVVYDDAPPGALPAVAPGVVDTTMQETIRGVDERVWPDRERFVHLHRQGKLTSPGHVADWLAAIAFDPSTGRPRSSTRIPDEHPR